MKRPWTHTAQPKPWNEDAPQFGNTRNECKEYNTRRWQRERKVYLNEHPLCVQCEQIGLVTMATVLDHIRPVRDGVDFWDRTNWQGLCTKHHRMKTNTEINKRR